MSDAVGEVAAAHASGANSAGSVESGVRTGAQQSWCALQAKHATNLTTQHACTHGKGIAGIWLAQD